eukprot:1922454-Prymnesium_polylepis.1
MFVRTACMLVTGARTRRAAAPRSEPLSGSCGPRATLPVMLVLGVRAALFEEHGVDFYFSGHVHSYERQYP